MTIRTAFAPAERAESADVERQHRRLQALPFVRDFLDAMPNMAVVLNAARQIVFANRAFNEFLAIAGADAELSAQRQQVFEAIVISVLGKRPGEALGCVHARDTEGGCGTTAFCRQCGAVRAILNSQQQRGRDVQECRMTLSHPDGREASLDLRVWAQSLDVDGEAFTVFSVVDISDEKRRQALERIFFHDVMNTASGLQGLSSLLRQEGAPLMDVREAAELMSYSVDQLVEEIEAQRSLSAAEAGDLAVTPQTVRSMELIRRVMQTMRLYSASRGKDFLLDAESAAFEFTTDAALVRRVLVNLVKNALEAVASGAVTLAARTRGDEVIFTVHNDSVMPSEVQLQVFQRSFSTKGAGRGLGTYSIKLLTQGYLGGRVSFVSREGEGTTFTVVLPRELKTH